MLEPHPARRGWTSASMVPTLVCGAVALLVGACNSPLQPLLELMLSRRAVEFRAVRGTAQPLVQTIVVTNAGGGRLGPVSCPEAPASWLTCSVATGNIVTLRADPAGLTESPPPASVALSAPGVATATALTVDLVIDQPVVGLSAAHVSFQAVEGSVTTTPGTRVVTLSNLGAGSLAHLGVVACEPAAGETRVQCEVQQGTGQLTVTVDPAGLLPGTYMFPLTVSASHSDLSQELSATLTVSALPRIGLSNRTVHFQAIRGTTAVQTQTVTVTNTGAGTLGTVSCPTNPAPWLTCAVSAGTLTLQASPAGLAASPAPVTVNVTATGAANSPQAITVNFSIEQPVLTVSATSASFVTVEDATTTTPASIAVTVTNSGAGALSHLGPITCAPAAGSPVTCTVNQATGVLTLQVDPAGADPGVTFFPVLVTSPHSSVSRTITVSLSVAALPRLRLSASAVHLQAIRGTTVPVVQVITISNAGGGSLGAVSCPASPAAWLTCAVNGMQLTLTANPTGLVQSPETVVVPVTAENAANSPQEVAVSFTIQQPVLSLNQSIANFTATGPNTTNPASVTVQASNSGAGTLTHLGELTCSAAAPVGCVVDQDTGAITLTVSPTGLGSGTHVFVATVSAAHMANAPQPVTVILTVP